MKHALIGAVALFAFAPMAFAQQGDGTSLSITTSVFKPARVQATQERVAALKAPSGFAVTTFATNLQNARWIVTSGPNIYVSRRDQGDVILLKDENRDGVADGPARVVANRAGLHGLAVAGGKLYMATVKEVFVSNILEDGTLSPPVLMLADLPDGGQHPNRTLAFGPDGYLYVSVGSTCNACSESNPEHASLLRVAPDGKSRTIFARGLRNTLGFDWHPTTGELWGMDHGIDDLGDNQQPEELNLLEYGKSYGWPHVFGAGDLHPQTTPPGMISKAQIRDASTPMILGYTAHAAPMAFIFGTGSAFPVEYQNDAFVAMRGSWNRQPASGYEIVRIRFANGRPQSIEPFVTGFLTDGGATHIARPVGLAFAADGALLMTDDANGAVYRVTYQGGVVTPRVTSPAAAMISQTSRGVGVPLAKDRAETQSARAPIAVTSPTISNNGAIPKKHSDYADGVSPALRWTSVRGAKSYAIIMEDPDAKPITPFVHWVAWNIPAHVQELPEGLQEQERLTLPDGMMQGRNSRNAPAYFGPQPPVGDADHHYVFQVLALDTVLDLPLGANRDDVLKAAQGHVIGKGALIGRYAQRVAPPKAGDLPRAAPARLSTPRR